MTNWSLRASNRLGAPPPPGLGGWGPPSNGAVSFLASAIPGRTYRVEYKDSLTDAAWIQLEANRLAAGPTLTITDEIGGRLRRFYRVVLLQ